MKKIIILTLFVFLALPLFSGKISWDSCQLKGKVKKWVFEFYNLEGGRKKTVSEITLFNPDGTAKERVKLIQNQFHIKETYYYENGNLVIWKKYKQPDKVHSYKKFSYYNKRLKEIHHYSENKLTHFFVYTYKNEGRTRSIIKKNSQGMITEKKIIHLDENRNIISEVFFNNKNQEMRKFINTYQHNNLVSQIRYFRGKKQIKMMNRYKYGNKVLELTYDKNDVLIKKISHHYQNNRLIKDELWQRGKNYSNTIYTYNSAGQLVRLTIVNSKGKLLIRINMEYDLMGNVIKKETVCPGCRNMSSHFMQLHRYEYY